MKHTNKVLTAVVVTAIALCGSINASASYRSDQAPRGTARTANQPASNATLVDVTAENSKTLNGLVQAVARLTEKVVQHDAEIAKMKEALASVSKNLNGILQAVAKLTEKVVQHDAEITNMK